ncbi:hypothetical protein M427DRAFT_51975 [Gonapodya prolifera JEL478]|uniref:Zn(2)-C6 fungal-type domain-containing protein n=1 Tax=Gonapodya prolifera (strain JEL478) TaxID=1344416 RepID=A0A139AWC0_GONPJ|nr:hypothetical protein M427DRAFT_51975 [Gonapodya prolifera JEL478]|eukprot:KXS21041.1 hypothetical protein M427DRAFT_51975 [Gonapodya prolifera JEL478]
MQPAIAAPSAPTLLRLRPTCDACVKRKIHCDGSLATPCNRCVRLNVQCVFSPLREPKKRTPRPPRDPGAPTRTSQQGGAQALFSGTGTPASDSSVITFSPAASGTDTATATADMMLSSPELMALLSSSTDHLFSDLAPHDILQGLSVAGPGPADNGLSLLGLHQHSHSHSQAHSPSSLSSFGDSFSFSFPAHAHLHPHPMGLGALQIVAPTSGTSDRIPLELSIFDDLAPLPSPQVLNSLVFSYFSHQMQLNIIHRPSFLASASPNPILLYAALAQAGATHEELDIRQAARRVFYPRLQRLLKAEWETPTLEGVVGMLHGVILAGNWRLWEQSSILMACAATSIRHLRLHSPDLMPRLLANLPEGSDTWVVRETARRVYWLAANMDSNSAASANTPRLLSGEEARMVQLPCPAKEWLSPSLPSSSRTTMPTLGEILTRPDPDDPSLSNAQLFVSSPALYTAFLYLFGRAVDVHRYCATRGWLHFSPPDGTPAKRVKFMMEELEEEIEVWWIRFEMWEKVADKDEASQRTSLTLAWHALWTVLHGPTVSLMPFGFELLVTDAPSRVFPKLRAEDVLEAWCSSKSFLTAVSHAIEASNGVMAYTSQESRFGGLSGGMVAYFLGQVTVILLLPALRMVQAGLDVVDLERRTTTMLNEIRRLESAAGTSVVTLLTALIDQMVKKLGGAQLDNGVWSLFRPDEDDNFGEVLPGEQLERDTVMSS